VREVEERTLLRGVVPVAGEVDRGGARAEKWLGVQVQHGVAWLEEHAPLFVAERGVRQLAAVLGHLDVQACVRVLVIERLREGRRVAGIEVGLLVVAAAGGDKDSIAVFAALSIARTAYHPDVCGCTSTSTACGRVRRMSWPPQLDERSEKDCA